MIVVGIDPGKRGAIVVLDHEHWNVVEMMPDRGDGLVDIDRVYSTFWAWNPDAISIERPQVRPKEGRVSISTNFEQYGRLLGAAEAYKAQCARLHDSREVHVRTPAPKVWQKIIPAMIQGHTPKERSIKFVSEFMPEIQLIPPGKRVPQDGIADAACIAGWALSRFASQG